MSESRKLTTIVAADVVGYSRLAATDEERTVARLRALRGDLIDPAIAAHHGRIVKRTGDGTLMEFRSVVDAVRCAIEVQNGMVERNAGLPPERQIQFRVGIHLGDVIEEVDGDLMGDGVNIAARLENICEPGAICLSEDAYRYVRSRLDLAVTDLGNKELKNIPEPVHVFSLDVGKPAQAKRVTSTISVIAAPQPAKRPVSIPLAAVVAVVVIAAVVTWYFLVRPGANLAANAPAHLSIVVLPFQNLSGDPKQDYFADGITDNLTTDLSRIRDSFVIARDTAFTFKGKNVDARDIGKELGVRYVLEGSVARDGDRVRVNVQLIDAESGAHLWAERFEEDLADLFKLQDDVVARLANSLGYELTRAEAAKSAHSTSPDAIDLTMRGWAIMWQEPSEDGNRMASDLFGQALKLEPQNVDALAGEAYTVVRAVAFWRAAPDRVGPALEEVNRAIVVDPDNPLPYYVKSGLLLLSMNPKESLSAAQLSLRLNPNSALAVFAVGRAEFALELFTASIEHVEQAIRISPRDPQLGLWRSFIAGAEIGLGQYQAAADEAQLAIDGGYRIWLPYLILAEALSLERKDAQAKNALTESRRLNPALTVKWFRAWYSGSATEKERAIESLRKAGLPEDAPPPPPKHLSIVVLPFDNLSGDAKQDYLADVLTDELTTYISRIPGSFVIARNTAFTYKGKAVDAKEIGKELGVRYVLEGSVQPTDKRIRTNAQLIDTETGAHLWAEEFDTDKTDILQTEDEIVTRLARTLQIQMNEIEVARLQRANLVNPDAQELALRCRVAFWNFGDFGKQAEAGFHLCEQALEIDPNHVLALATLSLEFFGRATGGQSPDRQTDIRREDELASRALAIDPHSADAHHAKTAALVAQGRFEEARAEAERTIALNPSQMEARGFLCMVEGLTGEPDKTIQCVDKFFQLSPRDPLRDRILVLKGDAYLMMRQDEQAVESFRRSLALNPNFGRVQADLAAALALTGHEAEAHDALSLYLSFPDTRTRTIAEFKKQALSNNPVYLAYRERFYEGLRKAGLAEDEGPRLSILVLPFQNLSGDAKQDYLADVLTDELTTYISRIPGSFVIARNTAFTYKGKAVDAKEIGKELGVRYVLEGSVQPTDKRIRTNAQLIDTETGAHLWAEEFDTDKIDLLETEDQIVTRLARSLQIQLTDIEAAKLEHAQPGNPDAQELALRCEATVFESSPFDPRAEIGYGLCEQALRIDPNNVVALSFLAVHFALRAASGQSTDLKADLKRADEFASKAIVLDPNSSYAHSTRGLTLIVQGRFDEARPEDERAIALDPSSMEGRAHLCSIAQLEGRSGEAIACIDGIERISPRDPILPDLLLIKASALLMEDKEVQALETLRRSATLGPNSPLCQAYLAATLALLGKEDEARATLARYMSLPLTRAKTIAAIKKHSLSNNPIYLAMLERVYAGLRKAGMPEDDGPRLSIVVLPFENLSGDAKQNYLADVLTDELTTYISRIPGSFVIARNTAFTYKGKPTDAKAIGQDLGVRYMLEGSVQPTDKRIRTNAQLIGTETGAHLWAEEFDTGKTDLLETEDEIVTRLARTLQLQMTDIDAARLQRVHPDNADAQELALRCQASIWNVGQFGKPADAGYRLCEQALEIDPNNVAGLTTLPGKLIARLANGQSPDRQADIEQVDEMASRALAIDPNSAAAHQIKGAIRIQQRRFDAARVEAERALALNPSGMIAYTDLCILGYYTGQPQSTVACVDKAMSLSPRDPERFLWMTEKADAYLMLGQDDKAVEWWRRAVAVNPNMQITHAYLAAALALTGHDVEARQALADYLSLPGTRSKTVAALRKQANSDNSAYLVFRERIYAGLRMAGMPEDDGPPLSIVVLPFENLSGDAKQDYLADVLTDDLTTYISRIPGSFVIARNTAFTYKGKPTDAKAIGQDLGVRYMLEGSVQPTDKRIRTNAQLIDTETGAHLWAEEFDTDKTDLLETEDEIVTRLARTLQIQLTEVEAAKLEQARPTNLDAQELALRCRAAYWNYGPIGKEADAGFHLCEQALEIDPNNVVALATLPIKFSFRILDSQSPDRDADIKRADDLVSRALAIDPNSADAHANRSDILRAQRQFGQARTEAERAIALDPSLMEAYTSLCAIDYFAGEPESAIAHADKALRLSPRDPQRFVWMGATGYSYFMLRHDEEAVDWLRRAVAVAPIAAPPLVYLAAALALTGHDSDAHETLARYLSLPTTKTKTIAAFKKQTNAGNAVYLTMRERLYDGLRKAGMPEQ